MSAMNLGLMGLQRWPASRVVEIDDVEFRLDLVMLSVLEQMVVGYLREVRKLVVIDIHGKGFLDLLFDVVVHHGIALSGARCSQYDRGSERFTILIQPSHSLP